jgi:hypothetical protein
VVNGFSGDGLRAFDGALVRHNRVLNCVKIDANHPDGFQSYAGASGSVTGLTIESNMIIEWTGASDHPLRCKLQGIGLFDGFYDNLIITNNLVAVSAEAYHGISVYGGRKARIVNNTVVDLRNRTLLYPAIRIANHKNGTPSTDVLVANNAAMRYFGDASVALNVTFLNNLVIGTPGAVFENPTLSDYRPKRGSALIDTANLSMAPMRDHKNQPRPAGSGPELGAYEVQADTASASIAAEIIEAEDEGEETGAEPVAATGNSPGKWIKIPKRN